jgi:proline dehydrogenase
MVLPFATRVARRFVAGETLDDAIAAVKALNAKGMMVSLDHLGENVHTQADADRATQAYLDLITKIAETKVEATCSLKLTQLGLDIGQELCIKNMQRILDCAASAKNFVRIDMESSAYTDRTLAVYHTLRDQLGYKNVGVVIQAYLFRSEADMRALAQGGANVRLCKGAYNEPAQVAFPDKADVDKNYIHLTEIFLAEEARAHGAYLGVATHDENMIHAAKAFVQAHGIDKHAFEFQMLYGIRPQLQEQLAHEGYQMQVYVPYGTEWYPYFMRRLAERPANVWFIAKNFFQN